MTTVDVHEAQNRLPRLLNEVEGGANIVITRAGQPVARLVPLRSKSMAGRKPGFLKGKLRIAKDFDHKLPAAVLAELVDVA